jgi:hypothetical protein
VRGQMTLRARHRATVRLRTRSPRDPRDRGRRCLRAGPRHPPGDEPRATGAAG